MYDPLNKSKNTHIRASGWTKHGKVAHNRHINNFDEYIFYNLDGNIDGAFRIGLGFHYMGYNPTNTDVPTFRNLGGIGLNFLYEDKYFGGGARFDLYRNSEVKSFARYISLQAYGKIPPVDLKSNLLINVEYFQLDYAFKSEDVSSKLSGFKVGIVYSFD